MVEMLKQLPHTSKTNFMSEVFHSGKRSVYHYHCSFISAPIFSRLVKPLI